MISSCRSNSRIHNVYSKVGFLGEMPTMSDAGILTAAAKFQKNCWDDIDPGFLPETLRVKTLIA